MKSNAKPRRSRERNPLPFLMLFALASLAAPDRAAASPADTLLPAPPAPRPDDAVGGFWDRLRAEARRTAADYRLELRYVRRWGISRDLARMIDEEARSAGVDPELAFRLVHTESRFNPRARGPRGALGLTQLMPSTARWLDRSMRSERAVLEPRANLRAGFRYLRMLMDRYDGDVRLALLAYNRGTGTVSRHLRAGRDPGNGYARRVLGLGFRYDGPGRIPPASAGSGGAASSDVVAAR